MTKNIKRKRVKALVMTGFGLNCENETAAAFEYCGADVENIHLNDLLLGKCELDRFQIFAFIGGFSFGDHLGAGTVLANRMKFRMKTALRKFISNGNLIIGICNGFQTLSRLGLLPALGGKYFSQQVALAHNDSGIFRDDWVHLKANPLSPCVFTKGLDLFRLPVRHGEGKLLARGEVLEAILAKNLFALQYCDESGDVSAGFPYNPNGSAVDIAGICDESGRIFGLMPHPEAYLSPYNAPDWTARKLKEGLKDDGDGVKIFSNAVRYAKENL